MARTKEEREEIKKDLGAVAAITAIADMEGGKTLVKNLLKDVVSCVDSVCSHHETLTLQQFISLGAEMKTKLDMVRVISRSKKNKKYLEELLAEPLQE